jgi:hypothetical protein
MISKLMFSLDKDIIVKSMRASVFIVIKSASIKIKLSSPKQSSDYQCFASLCSIDSNNIKARVLVRGFFMTLGASPRKA